MKFRITITTVVEYEPISHHYNGSSDDPESMLKIDVDSARDDPFLFMEMDEASTEVTGEIIG